MEGRGARAAVPGREWGAAWGAGGAAPAAVAVLEVELALALDASMYLRATPWRGQRERGEAVPGACIHVHVHGHAP